MGHGLKKAKAAAQGKVYRQAAVWVPPTRRAVELGGIAEPDRVWRLPGSEESKPPGGLGREPRAVKTALGTGEVEGVLPRHGYNAFHEDRGHDWTWLGLRGGIGRLRYNGSGILGHHFGGPGFWLLLEYGVR